MRNKLREVRLQKGYTQQQMAFLTDMSITFYHNIEKGKNDLTFDKAMKIKKVLDYFNDDLFENSENGDE